MFLEERSPLRVRVRSKKCELFFLKKIDALKISTAYPNIWRRINKKSVYNFKQIKKNIKKIVQIYCSVKKVNEKNSDESLSNDGFISKKSSMWVHPKNFELDNSALDTTRKNIIEKRNNSQELIRIRNKESFFEKYGINDDYFNDVKLKNIIQEVKKTQSFKNSKTTFENAFGLKSPLYVNNFSFSDSSSSSSSIIQKAKQKKIRRKNNYKRTKKKKLTKKLLDVFNRNYMYYKGINKKNNEEEDYPITIIAEETDKECSQNPILKSNNNSVYKNSVNSKTKILNDEDTNPINRKNKKKHKKSKSKDKKGKQSLFGLTDIKINNYETVKNREILINTSEEDNREIKEEDTINNEINPDELIQFNNTENLLDKKFEINTQSNLENNIKINSNIEQSRNRDLAKLLKYFDEESKSIHLNNTIKESSHIKSSNKINHIANNSNKLIFNRNNDSSDESSKDAASSINLNLKAKWDSNSFSIKNDISLTINSSYENYNLISGEKLIKSKVLQSKLKEYLITEAFNISNKDMGNIKKINSLEQGLKSKEDKKKPILKNLSHQKRVTSSIVYNTTNINYINSVQFMKNKPKRVIKKSSSLINKGAPISIDNNSEKASDNYRKVNRNSVSQIKSDIKPFENEFYGKSTKSTVKFNFNTKFAKKKQSEPLIKIKSSNNIQSFDISHHKSFNLIDDTLTGRAMNYETTKEIPRRNRRRNSVLISSGLSKGKKKKDNLLSLIDYNIQRTNQKLNDPDGFYSNYFSNILKEEMKEKNKKKS